MHTLWTGFNLVCVCVCYFPPPVKHETLKDFVQNISQQNDFYNKRIMFLGDFNLPEYGDPNVSQSNALTNIDQLIHLFNLESINNVQNKNERTLDLCLTTSNFAQYNVTRKKCVDICVERAQGLLKPDRHQPLLVIGIALHNVYNSFPSEPKQGTTEQNFNYKKADFNGIRLELENLNWQDIFNSTEFPDPNAELSVFLDVTKAILNKHIPLFPSEKRKPKFPSWWHYETKKLFKSKERLRKIKHRSNKQENKYLHLRKLCKKQIKNDYNTYIENTTKNLKSDSSLSWKYFKEKKEHQKNKY